jgi:hypothetical protein
MLDESKQREADRKERERMGAERIDAAITLNQEQTAAGVNDNGKVTNKDGVESAVSSVRWNTGSLFKRSRYFHRLA